VDVFVSTVAWNCDGKIKGNIKLSSKVQDGNHRFVVDGKNANGSDVLLALGAVVGDESSGLSATGKLLIALPIGLAIIFGLVIPTTLRRRRRVVPA
jgi:hypothetical protein